MHAKQPAPTENDPSGAPVLDHRDLAARIQAAREALSGQIPGLDDGDLLMILHAMLRPVGSGRRFFFRQIRPGVYVP